MKKIIQFYLLILLMLTGNTWADRYQYTINVFKNTGESANYFSSSYGHSVFPTIGKDGPMYETGIGGQKFFHTPRK